MSNSPRFFVPEVVQTSAMDCGPATLKCLLEGYGIHVSYGRLREACQTDVDGTSIDTMEEVALQLGLEAEQVMIPPDHLLLPEADSLPAIVVTRQPSGLTHFVVVWSMVGPLVQVMDPASGRRWLTPHRLRQELYHHEQAVPAEAWRAWAVTEGFSDPLRRRLADVGCTEEMVDTLIAIALADDTWYSLAALDAVTRMIDSLVQAEGLYRDEEAAPVLGQLFERLTQEPENATSIVPDSYWSVQRSPQQNDDDDEHILLRGAVLVRVLGHLSADSAADSAARPPLSPELVAALEEKPQRLELEILRFLREDGMLVPSVVTLALGLSAVGVMIEALLFRGLLDIGYGLNSVGQRVEAIAALFVFIFSMLLIEWPIANIVLRVGRRLETRLRVAFLEKIPRLGDRYFHSRLTSDMTQRAYDLRQVRLLPNLGLSFIRTTFQLLFTTIGVIWLDPYSAPLALFATGAIMVLSVVGQPLLQESDMRLRTHTGALSRFYLDALIGLLPIRTHSAERVVRRAHESLLVEWGHANNGYNYVMVSVHALEAGVGWLTSVLIVFSYIWRGGDPGGVLLLFYWTLSLPVLGQTMAEIAQQYPLLRNRILRLIEPLGAPEEEIAYQPTPRPLESAEEEENSPPSPETEKTGIAITLEEVTVQAAGHTILSGLNFSVKAGEHIGIVGPSGAGKSSLVGLLLGWHRPISGSILIDGEPLGGKRLPQLRREIAWVDPAVHLWNRSLFDNLQYGVSQEYPPMSEVIQQADLFSVLERLPQGLQTKLGEGGGLISGGEGQRVRLGRAMVRPDVRLAILDEPFRGLDRGKREQLLQEARRYWQEATLLCITHDVGDTQLFDRVVVVEEGHIVEDGTPTALLAQPNSRYRALVEAEEAVRTGLWQSAEWRRLWLTQGQLQEKPHD